MEAESGIRLAQKQHAVDANDLAARLEAILSAGSASPTWSKQYSESGFTTAPDTLDDPEQARMVELDALRMLQEANVPPCTTDPAVADTLIAQYWKEVSSKGLLLTAQLEDWEEFIRFQEWERKLWVHLHIMHQYQWHIIQRRKLHGLDGHIYVEADHEKQTRIARWYEYQHYQLEEYMKDVAELERVRKRMTEVEAAGHVEVLPIWRETEQRRIDAIARRGILLGWTEAQRIELLDSPLAFANFGKHSREGPRRDAPADDALVNEPASMSPSNEPASVPVPNESTSTSPANEPASMSSPNESPSVSPSRTSLENRQAPEQPATTSENLPKEDLEAPEQPPESADNVPKANPEAQEQAPSTPENPPRGNSDTAHDTSTLPLLPSSTFPSTPPPRGFPVANTPNLLTTEESPENPQISICPPTPSELVAPETSAQHQQQQQQQKVVGTNPPIEQQSRALGPPIELVDRAGTVPESDSTALSAGRPVGPRAALRGFGRRLAGLRKLFPGSSKKKPKGLRQDPGKNTDAGQTYPKERGCFAFFTKRQN